MYHDEAADAVLKTLDTSETGLSSGEAENRLEKYGKNELKEEEKTSAVKLFLSQFKSFLILILIVAALFSALLFCSQYSLQEFLVLSRNTGQKNLSSF